MVSGFRSPRRSGLVARARRVYLLDLLARAYQDFTADDGAVYAAAVAYYVLFSLFPLLTFLVAVFGVVVRDPEVQARVVDAIVAQIPEGINLRRQVENVVSGVAETNNGLFGLLALGGTIWTASGMFGALRRALNSAFDVETRRSFLRGRLMDIGGVLGVTLLALVSAGLSALLGVFRATADEVFTGFLPNLVWGLVYLLLPLTVSFLVFLAMFRWIPNHTLRLRDLWPGALIAAFGFEFAKAGFGLYLANFGRYTQVYGAIGGVVAFLFFVFLAANIVILAAEFASELAKDRAQSG